MRAGSRSGLRAMTQVLVFDVNGTLLDTEALKPLFRSMFETRYSVEEWFHQFIGYSMAMSLTGEYRDFGDIAITVLKMAGSARDIAIESAHEQKVREGMRKLPPFSDVNHGLTQLRDAGYRLVALSNSGTLSLEEQLKNAGI